MLSAVDVRETAIMSVYVYCLLIISLAVTLVIIL